MTLEELFAGRPINVKQVLDHLSRVAAELGLPFGKREKTFNSRMAQELGKLAEQQGYGEQFHMAAFKAYFADGLGPVCVDRYLGLLGHVCNGANGLNGSCLVVGVHDRDEPG